MSHQIATVIVAKEVDKILSIFLLVVIKLIKYIGKLSKFLATCLNFILDGIFFMYNIMHSIATKSLLAS